MKYNNLQEISLGVSTFYCLNIRPRVNSFEPVQMNSLGEEYSNKRGRLKIAGITTFGNNKQYENKKRRKNLASTIVLFFYFFELYNRIQLKNIW